MKLKPSPFCGSERAPKSAVDYLEGNTEVHYVWCSFIKSGCGVHSWCFDTEEQAAEAWNRRADTDCQEGVCPL